MPDQMRGTSAHRLHIERVLHPPDEAALMHHRRAALHQTEQVATLNRGEPRVKIVFHPCAGDNRDLRGLEMEIQRLGKPERIPVFRKIRMGDLRRRMDARIGAPCRRNRVIAWFQPRKRCLDRALHRGLIRLPLPSGKGGAMVFDFQSISGHGLCLAPRAPFRNSSIA